MKATDVMKELRALFLPQFKKKKKISATFQGHFHGQVDYLHGIYFTDR